MMIPAPTPLAIFTKTRLLWARPWPCRCSASAPRLASFSTWTGAPNTASAAARASTPSQPGKIADDLTTLLTTGAGRPRPTCRSGPTPGSIRARIDAARPSPDSCPWGSTLTRSSDSTRPVRSPTATATCRWPKSMPTTMPALAESRTAEPRRPLPGSMSSRPSAVRSRTMFDTVAGASPVRRAISAWVWVAFSLCSRSTASTRCWFAARSDAVEPGAVSAEGGTLRAMGEPCLPMPLVVKT